MSTIKIAPFGAHVLSAPTPLGDLLWLSATSPLTGPDAIRGGIPVIAPRFGTFMPGPKHGWARTTTWSVATTNDAHTATTSHDDLSLRLEATPLDNGIEVNLTVTNDSDVPKALQQGLHPYFLISSIDDVRIEGLEGADFVEVATGAAGSFGDEALRIAGEFDRVTRPRDLSAPIRIVDPGLGRVVELSFSGHDRVVVWNPGGDLGDAPAGSWREFVCVEPAILGDALNGTELSPGASLTLGMRAVARAL